MVDIVTTMEHFDVAIIGGGAVGCAILHELSLKGYACVLLEKDEHLVMGTSSGNSGIYASGFDTDPSTLEGRCLGQATAMNETIYKKYKIPRGNAGAIVCAFTEDEVQKLPLLLAQSQKSGVVGCKLLTCTEIRNLEPHITSSIRGGMWVPAERTIEPFLMPITLAHMSKQAGAKVLTSSEVVSGQLMSNGGWELNTGHMMIRARAVVNAGGLYGDRVEEISHKSPFRIKPRLGEFVMYSKVAGSLVKHILLPVPTERTKGVIIYPSVHGDLVVGPTADDVDERVAPSVHPQTVAMLTAHAQRVIPELANHAITGTYAGLRPATEYKDYCIKHYPDRRWVTVGGIRSTGLSACLAIASYTHHLLEQGLGVLPSRQLPLQVLSIPTWQRTGDTTLALDGEEYQITHPITKMGLPTQSRL